ncbi:CsbD family protein [soil metagenome]
MNKDQVKGRAEDLKGKIKEGAAEVTGNDRLKAEGQLDQAAGKTQAAYGDAKENVKDAVNKKIDRA